MKYNHRFASSVSRSFIARAALVLLVLTSVFSSGEVALASDATPSRERILSWQGSPDGVSRIELRAGNGSARVTAVDGDQIRVRLTVKRGRYSDDEPWRGAFRWFLKSAYKEVDDLKQAIELEVQEKGPALEINPLPHGRSRENKIHEAWEIDLPKSHGITIEMNSAEVEVKDLEGGVEVRLEHGEAVVDVPRGALDLRVRVGKINARVRDAEIGNLELESRVGDTRLWLDGNRVRYPSPPGPGSSIEIDGDGPDDLRVRVEVGDATLRVD